MTVLRPERLACDKDGWDYGGGKPRGAEGEEAGGAGGCRPRPPDPDPRPGCAGPWVAAPAGGGPGLATPQASTLEGKLRAEGNYALRMGHVAATQQWRRAQSPSSTRRGDSAQAKARTGDASSSSARKARPRAGGARGGRDFPAHTRHRPGRPDYPYATATLRQAGGAPPPAAPCHSCSCP